VGTEKVRWWELWSDNTKREQVEEFWKKDPAQAERRAHFYTVLQKVVAEASVSCVLDFGCGTCEDYNAMRAMDLVYTGVDVTPMMLARAREKYPEIHVSADDIFASRQETGAHPLVVNNAVLPHLPAELIPQAVQELWRITRKVLVIRLFGVGLHPDEDKTIVDAQGFIYQRWRLAAWRKLFIANCAPAPTRLASHVGETPSTKDIAIFVLWKA
jgi:SAM-dependent methyltransferase